LYRTAKVAKQFQHADKRKHSILVIIGEDEIASDSLFLKLGNGATFID
jgi:histidyl-tRNA synthetase